MSSPSPETETKPERPSAIFLVTLVAAITLGPLSIQIFLPALPIIQADFGVSAGTTQLTLSLSMAAIALATLAYGPISDRFGRRPVMLAGVLIFLAGSLTCTLASDIFILIVGRIIQAAGGTCGIVLSRAIVRDVYAEEKVAQVLAYLTIAMVIAPMMAPAIGGVLTDYIDWRAIFAFSGLIGLAVLVGVARRLAETHTTPATHPGLKGMAEGMGLLMRSARFNGFAYQSAFQLSIFFTFASAAPYVMVNVLGRPPAEYGLYFILVALAFILGNFVAARTSRDFGPEFMVITGSGVSLLSALAAAALAFAGYWSPWAIFGPAIVLAFGSGLSMPNAQAGALSVYPRSAGTASGLAGFLQMAVAAVFAQTVGVLQNESPYPMVVLMMVAAMLALISIGLGLGLDRRRERE